MEKRAILLVSLALGVGAGLVAAALGRLGLPLDDAWIHGRYALAVAEGHPLRYFAGEPVTTGTLSFLWPALLVPGALAARLLGPDALVGWTLALSALSAGLTFFLLGRTARAAGVPHPGWLVPLLFPLVAPLWFLGAFNGTGTGLFGLGLAAAAWGAAGGNPLWLLVPALAHPASAGLALAVLVLRLVTDRLAGRWMAGILVLAAAVLSLAGPRLLTGGPPAAWEATALLTEPHPHVRGFHLLRLPVSAAKILLFLFSGLQPPTAIGDTSLVVRGSVPLALAWGAFLLGGSVLAWIGRRGRTPFLLAVVAALTSLLVLHWDAQFHRRLVPAFPLLVLAATIGWFGEGFPTPRLRRLAGAVLAGLALALVFAHPTGFRDRLVHTYRGAVEDVRLNRWAAGERVDALLPPEARVAVHEPGAIAVAGRRPVVDLVGRVTPELTGVSRHGEGALWEAVSALPEERRPTHAAVTPAWMPDLYRTLWFGENLDAGGSPRRNVGSRQVEVWSLVWNAEPRTDLPAQHGRFAGQTALGITDHLDVASLASEREHAWDQDLSPWRGTDDPLTRVRDLGLFGAPPPVHAIEGGRELRGGGAVFRLAARDDASGVLVFRTTSPRPDRLVVFVGSWSDTLPVAQEEALFAETYTIVPPEILAVHRDGEGRVPVAVRGNFLTLYHVWLLQAARD